MVNLTQYADAPETVVLTLDEAGCGHTGPYAFLLTNAVTGATAYFTAPDVSDARGRYNVFLWQSVGPTGQDLLDGRVYLQDSGQYSYRAYAVDESAVQSLPLDPGDVLYLAETGYLTLRPRTAPTPDYTNEDPGTAVVPTYDE